MRTPAQVEAAARDGKFCLWCIAIGKLVLASDVHHLARRQPGADLPQLCLSLCHTCHMRHHNGQEPFTAQLLDLSDTLYRWDLRAAYPYFFANR